MASEFGRFERLLTIEDAFELGFDKGPERHADVKAMQAREANTEVEGAVTQTDLVRAALRKSPDRVIVGEIRGPEVVSVCNVISQGTDGSMTTIHASSTRGVFTNRAVTFSRWAARPAVGDDPVRSVPVARPRPGRRRHVRRGSPPAWRGDRAGRYRIGEASDAALRGRSAVRMGSQDRTPYLASADRRDPPQTRRYLTEMQTWGYPLAEIEQLAIQGEPAA